MPARRNPEPLTQQRLLEAALRLADEGGIEALSMRRLGSAVGADPMAVYHYFESKEALVRAVVQALFAEMRPSKVGRAWQECVKDWALAYRELALAHPKLALQIVTSPEAVATAVPIANRRLEAALSLTGLESAQQDAAAGTIVDYINGYLLGETNMPPDSETSSRQASFEFGLNLIVRGIEGLISGS